MADVKAVTRIEAILNGEDITPVTREEAILSGADVEPLSREEYFVQKRLGEGGGGLDYVIPEQTVTTGSLPNNKALRGGVPNATPIQNVNVSTLQNEDTIIVRLEHNNNPAQYIEFEYIDGDDGAFFAPVADIEPPIPFIENHSNNWYLCFRDSDEQLVTNLGIYTISAISRF